MRVSEVHRRLVRWGDPQIWQLAERFLRGCGWFALGVGGLLGLIFGITADYLVGSMDPAWVQQLFAHVLLGRLPTVLVAAFVLLRVNFQVATDPDLAKQMLAQERLASYLVTYGVTTVVAWIWFFLSVLLGTWLGMMHRHAGLGHEVWVSYGVTLEFVNLLHAALRMVVLALGLSALTFLEIKWLRTQRYQAHQTMSRGMTLGMLLIAGIEVLDFVWLLH